ncbi:hypothetical protein [Ethanoligenens harbinense]|uniref:Uncharacterized protein n=1 Tax=Ethanoligenens harbinense (strain DSM 18485 / JCM 12961 / CGMCC 1.5033 / YUAN-3) TaxID=663278 RepID=E6U5B0_ETHHY|nr:hypothetical protein [Ethanoligenens harbinense]ADU27923.1 hypothetical protein Ethha_2427 [Ethanoligenens harbinense YUAN-3]AVQ96951.1 hypothetical protein CXQ68_12470 [Ethanoligenens harbinense YUAN-3]AYF39611.1 hypothetical protein CXP51_12365 [Ethanoligenens harbinense]AYF42439.1 hypothetical protein CN246_12920 [Ethanoligenens harbinense]QCN93192.1 hypothetical protein DRA42_12515 [Ethanoligenens harbinense]
MQSKEKISRINEVLTDLQYKLDDLQFQNTACANEKNGTYYDYDGVIALLEQTVALLEQTVDRQKGTARNPRPANLPNNIAWRETFADPDEEFDPYVFDGSMSPEDYNKMVSAYEANRDHPTGDPSKSKVDYSLSAAMRDAERNHATVDLAHPDRKPVPADALPAADLRAGNTMKIRFFDPHGVYFMDTVAFRPKAMEIQAALATLKVDCQPPDEYAGWTAFEWNEQKRQWWPYRDKQNKGFQYDTGRRT